MGDLKKYITDTFGFTLEEYAQIEDFFLTLKLQKGDYFLKEGGYSKRLGFVEKGVLREFLYVEDKEITKWFSTPGYFAVDLNSFLFGNKSRVSYQALTDCELWILPQENYEKIGQRVERWTWLEKLFLARCFTVLENRVVSHLAYSAEERYHLFFKMHPELFNQAPLHYIASLLGMTPETLSRIRRKQLGNSIS